MPFLKIGELIVNMLNISQRFKSALEEQFEERAELSWEKELENTLR